MKFLPQKPYLLGETLESLTERLVAAGYPAFRAKQVLEWIYKRFELDVAKMTNLPEPLKAWLMETFTVQPARRVLVKGDSASAEGLRRDRPDTTQKLLLELEDKSLIETVLIKAPPPSRKTAEDSADEEDDPLDAAREDMKPVAEAQLRKTVCISTQVGCAYGCKFCASGLAGWRRDLQAGEIVAELFEIVALAGTRLSDKKMRPPFENIVVMGMGEPLANFDNLIRALTIVNAPWGMNFGARRITVSTSGVVPRIRELAEMPEQFRLAISLHGATNDVRNQIMPVNKRFPLEDLIPAARYYNEKHNRMLTFEYILIEGLNDTYEQAEALIALCNGTDASAGKTPGKRPNRLKVHINCIPYNKVEGLPWKRPSILRQQAFVKKLREGGLVVTVRHEKGHRIDAACGQLRLKEEKKREQNEPEAQG